MRGQKVLPLSDLPSPTEIARRKLYDNRFLYKLQVAQPLPVINLRVTPSSHFLSRNCNIRLLRWLKKNYALVSRLQRLGSAFMLAVIVKCMLFKSKLVLREKIFELPPGKNIRDAKKRSGFVKMLGISTTKLFFSKSRQIHHHQQVSLVPLRLSTIDTRRTVLLSWSVCAKKLSDNTAGLGFLYTLGLLGLGLSTVSIGLAPPSQQDSTATDNKPWAALSKYIPMTGLVFSVSFCGAFACGFQRDLLRSLLKNFGFLFPSIQFVIACFCLADMTQWDYRCYAILTICLWFHWVLLLDALTPPAKERFRFKKRFATPVVFSIWISIAAAVYAVVILDTSDSQLHERNLLHWQLDDRAIVWNTRSLFLSRIATILIWAFRLFYDIVMSDNDELLFVRGTLDYYCPFDTLPGAPSPHHKRVGAADSAAASGQLVAAKSNRRRTSYAESMLISYPSAPKRHSSSGVLCMLGRDQSSSAIKSFARKNSPSSVLVAAASALRKTEGGSN